jgi:tetratricopeptide (TPR) repeat protein
MDAKERHELKDNDLAEFLQNFGDFWNKNGNWIMIVVMLSLAGYVGMKWYRGEQAKGLEYAWSDLAIRSTPSGYRESAEEAKGFPAVQAQALLRGAWLFHEQALTLDAEGDGEDTGVMSAKESLTNAAAMYKQVLESDHLPVFRANAALGLANVSETQRDFEAAKGYWERAGQIADEARLAAISTQAQLRLDLIDSLSEPIVLVDAPKSDSVIPESTPDTPDSAETPASPNATDEVSTTESSAPAATSAEPGQ